MRHYVAEAAARRKQRKLSEVFLLAGRKKKPRTKNREPGSPGPGGPGKQGETTMKDALVAAALVFFAAIMLLFPSAWEPVTDAEARQVFDEEE